MTRIYTTTITLCTLALGLWWAANTTLDAVERQINEGWNER
jgi:hypothetical protein